MPQETGTKIFTEKLFITQQEAETRNHSNINQEKNGYIRRWDMGEEENWIWQRGGKLDGNLGF